MLDHAHYVPILLTKRGERNALQDLFPVVKERMTPLFTVPPRLWDYDNGGWKKTVDQHLKSLGKQLADCWPGRRAFIDLEHVLAEMDFSGIGELLTNLVNESAKLGTILTPVVTPGRDQEYLAAAVALRREHGTGVCVRLKPSSWPNLTGSKEALYKLIDFFDSEPSDIDLVIDLAEQVGSELVRTAVTTELAALPYVDEWRSLTLAGGAFPKDLRGIEKHKLHRIPRSDWSLYCNVDDQMILLGKRRPVFSDYGINHPDPNLMVNPRFLKVSGALRYTSNNYWMVAKGELVSDKGSDAVVSPARIIARAPGFCGVDFSIGDKWIAQVAEREVKGSNAEHWRRVATDHHLTFVTEQLARRFAPSNES